MQCRQPLPMLLAWGMQRWKQVRIKASCHGKREEKGEGGGARRGVLVRCDGREMCHSLKYSFSKYVS